MEWYHVCWPRLTAKRVQPVVSISWASCSLPGTASAGAAYDNEIRRLVVWACQLFSQSAVLSLTVQTITNTCEEKLIYLRVIKATWHIENNKNHERWYSLIPVLSQHRTNVIVLICCFQCIFKFIHLELVSYTTPLRVRVRVRLTPIFPTGQSTFCFLLRKQRFQHLSVLHCVREKVTP